MVMCVRMVVVVMMVMVVVMVMAVGMFVHSLAFFHTVNRNCDMSACDPAFDSTFLFHLHAWNGKSVQFFDKRIGVRQKLHEGRSQHITRSAHPAI
jgi:hypothetical protein